MKDNDTQKSYEEMAIALLTVDDFESVPAMLERIIPKKYYRLVINITKR